MKRILKLSMLSIILALILILSNKGEVKAALQANPTTQYKKTDTMANWIRNFRSMETTGEAMGLTETLGTDLSPSSASNNIDVHMMKSTEYGAIAILSASGYGNPSNDRVITSTTGNNTGMILDTNGKWEWVAGGLTTPANTNARYWDTYTAANTSAKIGDALGTATTTNPGCAGWHSATGSDWVNSSGPYFVRGYGGIFSFVRDNASGRNVARGVAVCGAGL